VCDERRGVMRRLFVRVWALLPEEWRGAAGQSFRQTTAAVSEYATEHVRLRERVDEAPDLAWRAVQGAASERHSQAVLNYAKEENERITLELERRTLEGKVRKEVADATKAEAEAGIARIREIEARIELVDKFRRLRVIPIWRSDGTMVVVRAPGDLDWDSLVSEKLIGAVEQEVLFGGHLKTITDVESVVTAAISDGDTVVTGDAEPVRNDQQRESAETDRLERSPKKGAE
jgi:hypothetical protein